MADAARDQHYTFPCHQVEKVTGAATYEAIYLEVLCTSGCVDIYCHGSHGQWADLDLSLFDATYDQLVNHETGKLVPVDMRATCAESPLLRVKPGFPEESLLYKKLDGTQPCGTMMPPPSSEYHPLSAEKLDQVRRWIAAGAPNYVAEQ